MTIFTAHAFSNLLDRLFAEAELSESALDDEMKQRAPDQRRANRSNYREFYSSLRNYPLPVSRDTGRLLYMLARATRARSIVEFGTSFGISTLHLAAALRDNGGGRLIGTEFEATKLLLAREHLEAGGVADLVELRAGDALETLASDLPESIDFVLLDGAKALYPAVLALLEDRLSAGALIVADNADASPEYLARVRSFEHGYVSVPFAQDVELSLRLHAEVVR